MGEYKVSWLDESIYSQFFLQPRAILGSALSYQYFVMFKLGFTCICILAAASEGVTYLSAHSIPQKSRGTHLCFGRAHTLPAFFPPVGFRSFRVRLWCILFSFVVT